MGNRYREIAELFSDFVYSIRVLPARDISFEWISPGFSSLTGLSPSACRTGEDFLRLIDPEDRASARDHFQVVLGGTPDERDLHIVAKNGAGHWMRFRAVPFRRQGDGKVVRVLGVAEEITENILEFKLLERRATERTRELSALLDISHNVASTLELEPLLGLILTELKKLVDYTGAAILMPEGDDLVLLDYRGPMPRELAMQLRIPLSRSAHYTRVIEAREAVIVPDLLGETVVADNFRRSVQRFMPFFGYAHSLLCVPLIVKDDLVGIFRLDHRERYHFTPHHANLAMAIASQAAVAMENARLYERAQRLAALEERQRIARELHDSVSQALYGINLGAETALDLLGRGSRELAEPLGYVRDLAQAGLLEMRALLFELRPEAMVTEGLIGGLQKMLASLSVRHKLELRAELCPEPEAELEVKEAMYRIAQEALNNVVKHARAKVVRLALRPEGEFLCLEIEDDGLGFDRGRVPPGHLGLSTMSERASRLKGSFEIASEPGKGTRVRARIARGGRASPSLTAASPVLE